MRVGGIINEDDMHGLLNPLVRGQQDQADKVRRFQNEAARPFRRINGAAAILDDQVH
jgi:hypothetical protein